MRRSTRCSSTPGRPEGVLAAALAVVCVLSGPAAAQPHPETILQYFETSWAEVAARVPEVAAAGYTAIWLPPPTKGAEGVRDVGFAVYDRFDLGDRDQRGTVATRYGTKAELQHMVREAHRFGLKVYFDTVMNHNSNPGLIENEGVTLEPARIEEYPGTHPLDYHVLPARDVGGGNWEVRNARIFGGNVYVMGPNLGARETFVPVTPMPSGTTVPGFTHLARAPWIDFGNAGPNEEQHLSLLGLIDFAIEQQVDGAGPAADDGINLVADLPLPRFVRFPDRPETYPNATPVEEDTREFMIRWVKWIATETDADGLRLDAIKHVPPTFFRQDWPTDPIAFNQAFQDDLDRRRGWTDADDDDGVQDGLLFGEAFTGDLGGLRVYRESGMYLLDFPLLFKLAHDGGVFARNGDGDIGQLSFPQGGMAGAYAEFGGMGRTAGVSFVQSHDTHAPNAQPNAAYAFTLSRVGHSVVFYDGNNFTPLSFVTPGRIDALGELGSDTITELVDIRRRFARGGMFNRFVDGDVYVYERVVPTTDGTGGATLLVALTDNTQAEARFGEFDPRPLVVTEFPPGTVLSELTGNGSVPQVTVLDPATIPAEARDRALAEYDRSSDFPLPARYGLVYLQIPAGPDVGYVMYGPRTPPVSIALTDGTSPLPRRERTTAPERRTPAGASVPAAVIRPSQVGPSGRLSVRVTTDDRADAVWLRIDGAPAVPGLSPESGTPDGLYDGFARLPRTGGAEPIHGVDGLDLSGLAPGVHLARVRVSIAGTPSFYTEATALLELPSGGGPGLDAGVTPGDAGGPEPDAGAPDSGVPDRDPDPDRDGIPSDRDLCPSVSDPGQADFDDDAVGDACDLCPESMAAAIVDADGCEAADPATREALDAIVAAILEERFDPALDANGDGRIDALDFVARARAGGAR
jgi:hypothetical protein